jgi:hypothetical protein
MPRFASISCACWVRMAFINSQTTGFNSRIKLGEASKHGGLGVKPLADFVSEITAEVKERRL